MNEFSKLKAQIVARLYATQLAQIKVWDADQIDLIKIQEHCMDTAEDIMIGCDCGSSDEALCDAVSGDLQIE